MIFRNENVNENDVKLTLQKHGLLQQKKETPEQTLEKRKKDLKYFRKAEKSYFYQKSRYEYSKITRWDDLLETPTWNYKQLQEAVDRKGWAPMLVKKPREWVATSGRTKHKWLPWGSYALHLAKQSGKYSIINGGLKDKDRVLALPAPAPFATGRIVEWLNHVLDVELLPGSISTTLVMMELVLKRKFDVGVSAPNLWLRIAEQFSQQASQKNFALKALSRIKKLQPKMVFQPRTFLCGGTTTTESMQKRMVEAWGAPIMNVLASTESFFMASGCYEDALNGETVYNGPAVLALDSGKEKKFLHDCGKGEEGELIVYRVDDSFPLIGYETGDIVKVVQTDECACGNKTPKIRFKARKGNDPLDVNGAKIWQDSFTDLMGKFPEIKMWELTVDYDRIHNKTVLLLKVEPYKSWKDLSEKILDELKTNPVMTEFNQQASAFFEDFKHAIRIETVEDYLTKKFEKTVKKGIYKPIEFEFTENYLKRGL